jgi:asparagine synthase (glutamine-hydrolysing)
MNLPGTDLWVAFNGEIYNFIELRSQLASEYRFRTGTDTEVLLCAYRRWGPHCLERLNGMFAFAIWDGERRTLFVARDRFGEKPAYYAWNGERFLLASELKSFLEDPDFDRQTDWSTMADFLLLSVQDHDERTFLAEAKQLPPAHWLELNAATGELSGPHRYWMPEIGDDLDEANDAGFEEKFRYLLNDSIRLRLRSDVRVGVCLSGGIDSTTICALAARQVNDPAALSAYTITFPGHPDDEAALAVQAAQRAGVTHLCGTFTASDLWNELRQFTYYQDGPTAVASNFASWRVFQLARGDGAIVLLNGQGGDELFGGYNKFYFFGSRC